MINSVIEKQLEKMALMYDLGKIVQRATGRKVLFQEETINLLEPYFSHMPDALKMISSNDNGCDPSAISYILHEAARIADGTDYRGTQSSSENPNVGMESVFNIFGTSEVKDKETGFVGRMLTDCADMVYPIPITEITVQKSDYEQILGTIKNRFDIRSPKDMSSNEILNLLENVATNIPYSTVDSEPSDVSLYDHSKLTAAFAMCMYRYFQEHNIADYKKYCDDEAGRKELSEREIFLLVSGDISGVQQFIYTIPSKGALKSLRGRSFYLEIMLENIIDEILAANGLSRECLLYSGGGHFYMILPNTDDMRNFLEKFNEDINEWFLEHFGSRLYIAMGYTPCTPGEFMADEEVSEGAGGAYRRVSGIISDKKIRRYSIQQLAGLFNPKSQYNTLKSGNRECGICHISSPALSQYQPDEDTMACPTCKALFRLGEKILAGDMCIVDEIISKDAVPIPALGRKLYLHAVTEEGSLNAKPIRRYIKNQLYVKQANDVRIWLGDYVVRNDEDNHVLEFDELAKLSGGKKDATSIPRLGVLRADVDNLGAAFMAGIPRKYATLSRTATLSRQLSVFFKRYMNSICAGNVNGKNESDNKKFFLFDVEKETKRNVHIVYSGGDDIFLVGSWDDLIELAVDIRRKFAVFTNNKLSFSAGLAMFQGKAPVAYMAKKAGMLEDFAKGNPGKDSLALFGAENEIKNYGFEATAQVYSWKQFTDSVCGEKLKFIKENFSFDSVIKNSDKLTIGKSAIYRILSFLEGEKDSDTINIARFAYVLARLNPGDKADSKGAYEKIREQFYEWYKNKEDRKELYTAFTFVAYSLRDKEEKA